ncbi:G protein gamma domain-containing protein [Heracleum sosnowskyi]|uniref:G protein gamma domain-containing protein n=1 Tax=Heracleum sosnowskyi TaxID=360622 RepID=A0AAD8ME69_9APIA|nr:G protein gamma domain-containing protein [Heracleum sosnowskyi]
MDPLTTEGDGNVVVAEQVNENTNRAAVQSLPNFVGKHRMTAAIALLNQQIQFLQEEIEQLDTYGGSSIVCKELIASVESNSDALLPVTKGPTDVAWERWFQRARSSKNRKKWI